MSELPSFDAPVSTFKVIKKDGSEQPTKKPSIHERKAIITKRYKCGYLLESGEPCTKAFDIKTAKVSHEKTHRTKKINTILDSDLLHIEVPIGVHKEWMPDNNFYAYDESITLPDGYKVIYRSPGVVSHMIKLPNMAHETPVSFYELTLIKNSEHISSDGINPELKKTITELKRRLTVIEKQVKK